MTIALRQVACTLLVVATSYGQATVSGAVHDDSGGVPNASSVQIQQIVPLKNRNLVSIGDVDKTPPPAPFAATASVDQKGTYSIPNVPVGTYVVCAYGTSQRLFSNCLWTSQYSTVSVESANVTVPPLVLSTGSVITIAVNDPAGAIVVPTQPFGTPPASGHYFFPGVIAENGYYSSARLVSQSGTTKTYVVTIPKTAIVRVFVDSDLAVTDAGGNTVPTRTPSSLIVQGTADTNISLRVC
jgi:hypothetical protein